MITKKFLFVSLLLTLALSTAAFAPASRPSKHPRQENFSQWPSFGETETWRYLLINGNGEQIAVNGAPAFDNSFAEISAGKELLFRQEYDPDFDAEFPNQYNNIAMIGFQGYAPDQHRDIVWNFEMKISPNAYGTSGFVIEPKNTFGPDGRFTQPFSLFGVAYAGAENYNAGLRCSHVQAWMPISETLIPGIDPHQWNQYEIRFHKVDALSVLASIRVNNNLACETSIENWGETEVQVWLDNYKVILDPASPLGYSIGFNNQETPQNAWFDNIRVKAEPVP